MPLDADDISALYRRHAAGMVAYFARRTYDAEIAVELTAETFAAAVLDRGTYRGTGEDTAVAWLYGIARHQFHGWLRRARVERRALAQLGLEPPVLTDVELERIVELAGIAALRAEVSASLAELSPGLRSAVRLRVVEERSYPEVAAALGVSEQTARARVSRALRALATTLASHAPEAHRA